MTNKLWTYLIVNFITNLLLVARKNVILAVYDRLFKDVHSVKTIEEKLAGRLVRFFRNNM